MSVPNREARVYGAMQGWQGRIVGTLLNLGSNAPTYADIDGNAGANPASQPLAGSGALGTGTYYFFLPTSGALGIDVTLLMSAHTGTVPTITLYKTLSDHVTEKLDASGGTTERKTITVSDNTQVTGSITDLRGEQGCLLKIVVPAASTATFTIADYSAA